MGWQNPRTVQKLGLFPPPSYVLLRLTGCGWHSFCPVLLPPTWLSSHHELIAAVQNQLLRPRAEVRVPPVAAGGIAW